MVSMRNKKSYTSIIITPSYLELWGGGGGGGGGANEGLMRGCFTKEVLMWGHN